jgi:hypothetical protein
MTDTPQPETAGETVVDPIAAAAEAFKTFDDAAPDNPDRPRDANGRFISNQPQEIEAEDEAQPEEGEAEADAESQEDDEVTDEAAEEAQPEAVDLPPSWPSDKAEMWSSLDPDAQAYIRQRDAEQMAATNAKFQEAANLRKAHEAEINEAQANRQRFAEAADFVLGLIQPQKPPATMLNPNSSDYNPDAYHLAMAQYQEQADLVSQIAQQRQLVAQQEREAQDSQAAQFRAQIEEKFGPLLVQDVPDLANPEKQSGVIESIARYAIDNGVPAEVFTDPERAKTITSADLRIAWKAMKYDEMKAAQSKVKPKAAKPAAPVVRPGVATPKSAVENAQRKKALERLDRSGSIADAAAFFKTGFKG